MAPEFRPGLELARRFYADVVRPQLRVEHSAALIGPGSEVLGFDTARSTDHDWGPRLLLFVPPGVDVPLDLPATYAGHPTSFALSHDPVVRSRVIVTDLGEWFRGWLGFDPRAGVQLLDWLSTPTQRLAEVTAGAVFHDGLGELEPARDRLRWYPDEVWRYVLACQWQRIGEEEPFVGRCLELGDEAGAAILAGRLARDLLRLDLLQHRRYPPYGKWLGTAARDLPAYAALGAPVDERSLHRAYAAVAATHNELAHTEPVDPALREFFDRPYRVLGAGRFAAALRATLPPQLAALPLIGAIDQFADNVALLGDPPTCRAVMLMAMADARVFGMPLDEVFQNPDSP